MFTPIQLTSVASQGTLSAEALPKEAPLPDSVPGRSSSEDPFMPVSRCVCLALSFSDLKKVADDESLDFEQLKVRTGCAGGCGMCEPYIRMMILTGETKFRVLTTGVVRKMLIERGINPACMGRFAGERELQASAAPTESASIARSA